jgi:hypothetical protein
MIGFFSSMLAIILPYSSMVASLETTSALCSVRNVI